MAETQEWQYVRTVAEPTLTVIKRCVARLFHGDARTVKTSASIKRGYAPGPTTCVQNAVINGGLPLVYGYRVSTVARRTRIGRIELESHVWNKDGDRWVDSTPSTGPDVGESLLIEDDGTSVKNAVAEYVRSIMWIYYGDSILETLARTTTNDTIARFSLLGEYATILPDGRYVPTKDVEETGFDERTQKGFRSLGASRVVYRGFAEFDKSVHRSDAINPRVDSSAAFALRDAKTCWWCDAPGVSHICQKCKKARYCSVDCQRSDWQSGHSRECALLMKM